MYKHNPSLHESIAVSLYVLTCPWSECCGADVAALVEQADIRALVHPNSIYNALNKLCDKGLAKRTKEPDHLKYDEKRGQKNIYQLTPQGRKYADEVVNMYWYYYKKCFPWLQPGNISGALETV